MCICLVTVTQFQLFLFISEHTNRHGCSTRGAKLRIVKGLQIKVMLKDTGYQKQSRAHAPKNINDLFVIKARMKKTQWNHSCNNY